jgi:hypothetical protein
VSSLVGSTGVDGGRNPAEPDCSGAAAGISSVGGATGNGDSVAEDISSAGCSFGFFVETLGINKKSNIFALAGI